MNTPEPELRPARPEDFAAIVALLEQCHLNGEDVSPERLAGFSVAERGPQLLGVCGFERSQGDGMLRSLAVAADQRKQRLGERLLAAVEASARAAGIERLYLLTTTADTYLRRLGYADVERAAVPPAIAAHPQFQGLCPASAKSLFKALSGA